MFNVEITETIKELAKIIPANATLAYEQLRVSLRDYAKKCEAENKLYKFSSGAFVSAFRNTATEICECRIDPFIQTYLDLADVAEKMLLKGDSQADVLYYFDTLLEAERTGKICF